MNVCNYIFSQVVDYIPRYQFDKLVAKYHGNWHAKDLTCYNLLLHLLFGQITGFDSLRDICLCLEAHKPILYHLSFRNTVKQSSLSRANKKTATTASMRNLGRISSVSSGLCIQRRSYQK